MAKGRLQDEVLADGSLDGETMASYSGIVICGCEGANPLATDERVAKLLREAHADGKLIGTWGNGLEALTRAGVVKGRKVTGAAEAADAARKAGARFTGRQLEADWVFAGSSFWVDPADGSEHYQADGGDMICVSNFPTAMLDLPIASSESNAALLFEAFTERLPPPGTAVDLVLSAGE